jgi:hypothetical protein
VRPKVPVMDGYRNMLVVDAIMGSIKRRGVVSLVGADN